MTDAVVEAESIMYYGLKYGVRLYTIVQIVVL